MKRFILDWGLILGGISILFTVILYGLGTEYMVNWKVGLTVLAVFIAALVYAGLRFRKKINGGYLKYWEAFRLVFFLMIASTIVSSLFSLLMSTVIDPELPQKMKEATIQATISSMEYWGAPQDVIDRTIDKMQNEPTGFTMEKLLWGILNTLIFASILSLILSLFIRKKRPVFEDQPLDTNTPA